jgi:GT2 family glycosyltransferase
MDNRHSRFVNNSRSTSERVMGSIRRIHPNHPQRNIHSPPPPKNTTEATPVATKKYQISEFPVGDWFQNKREVDVSIIVPCYSSAEVVTKQIANWHTCDGDGLSKEIVYVDDSCPTKSRIAVINAWQLKRSTLKSPVGKLITVSPNSGFSNACNAGASFASGRYLVFLNADTLTTENWIKPMHDIFLQNENVGVVGNLILHSDKKVDSCGSDWSDKLGDFLHVGKDIYHGKPLDKPFSLDNLPDDLKSVRQLIMITGACIMMQSKIFHRIKGFDPSFIKGYYEDSDLCMKSISYGYKNFYTPHSRIYHIGCHSKSNTHPHVAKNKSLFNTKWVSNSVLKGYHKNLKLGENSIKYNKDKIVIYTAITNHTNKYDNLKELPENVADVNKIAFLENVEIESKSWTPKPIHNEFKDPCRNAKIHKILSHKYFPEAEYSLWIDGSVHVKFPFSMKRLIEIYLSEFDIALFKHSERRCLYQELKVCSDRKLDNIDVMKKQVEKYKNDGYPADAGLSECTILLRRHTPKIEAFNEAWWEEIKSGSKRDQLSFDYVVRKHDLKVNYFAGHLRAENYLFKRDFHNKKIHQ